MQLWATLAAQLQRHGCCALVSVADVRGSTPREAGARMIIAPDGGFHGTIGGGELEWQAIAAARKLLQGGRPCTLLSRYNLGPDLGQCCGGHLRLLTEVLDASRLPTVQALVLREANGAFMTIGRIGAAAVDRTFLDAGVSAGPSLVLEGATRLVECFASAPRPLLLFGAGHVGRALMLALAPLPFDVQWIDERESAFPRAVPSNVTIVHATTPVAALRHAPQGTFVVVMTHNHALDLAIVNGALPDRRFEFVGLIGSKSKRGRFINRLRAAGVAETRVAALACPIGIGEIRSKHPAAIAASVAAQLLEQDEACADAIRSPMQLTAVQ